RRARRRATRRAAAAVPRAARGGRQPAADARTHVGRRALETEARRRVRADTTRPAAHPTPRPPRIPGKTWTEPPLMTLPLPHALDRSVLVFATRETVFRFFSDPARWAAWWGAGSSIDPRPGGAVRIRYPDGTEVAGD